ncbi:hypothetical protein [Nitrosospira briensis]|uniref:hypothetical protein n=1 Tax=Nitrosospira briensis TaxID=35799 RepID=UPI000469A8CB|nr:hypothetical protein [Nitrosospira briensis]
MSVIILPNRLNKQPQYAAPIDYAGLGKSIRILWNPAAGPVDLATGRIWSTGGNAAIARGRKGHVFTFDGADDYYGYTGYPEITGNVGSFFIWCPTVGAADTYGHALFGASSPVAFAHQINPAMQVHIGSSPPSNGTLPSWFNTRNRSLVLVSGGTAATCRAFLDGKDSGLTWPGAPAAWGPGNKNFNLGRYVGGTSWDFDGTILIAGHTEKIWGDAESRAFHDNPWQLFKVSPKKLWKSSGTIHYLTAEAPVQANFGDMRAVAQDHALVGSASMQNGTGSAGPLIQDQALAVAPVAQTSTSSADGQITRNQVLAVVSNAQVNSSSTGAVTQARMLIVPGQTQGQACSVPTITQTHIIVATAPTQENKSTTGILHIASGGLEAESAVQGNAAGAAIIIQTHILIVSFPSQGSKAATGAVSDGIEVEAALSTGMAPTLRIKKPGIPAGTPEWLKTMIELLTGRRGNRIMPPAFRALTFSAVPTRTECEALYAYTNDVRNAVERIITRLDS